MMSFIFHRIILLKTKVLGLFNRIIVKSTSRKISRTDYNYSIIIQYSNVKQSLSTK